MDSISAIATDLLDRYTVLLHERLVSRRASEDYTYWVRRFLSERASLDVPPTTSEIKGFIRQIQSETNSASATRRAEVALELLVDELLEQDQVA